MNKTVFNASGLQESQVLANFEVEELEKRYEMAWVSISAEVEFDENGRLESIEVTVTIPG